MSVLTPKQQLFVEEYLIDLNATQAAIRAGYSENTARSMGSENLSKPDIQEAISEAMQARSDRTEITADMVLQELAKPAFIDIRDAFDDENQLLPIKEMPEHVARAIGSIEMRHVKTTHRTVGEDEEITEQESIKTMKMVCKKGSLELIGRHLKMFTDVKQIEGLEDLEILVRHV